MYRGFPSLENAGKQFTNPIRREPRESPESTAAMRAHEQLKPAAAASSRRGSKASLEVEPAVIRCKAGSSCIVESQTVHEIINALQAPGNTIESFHLNIDYHVNDISVFKNALRHHNCRVRQIRVIECDMKGNQVLESQLKNLLLYPDCKVTHLEFYMPLSIDISLIQDLYLHQDSNLTSFCINTYRHSVKGLSNPDALSPLMNIMTKPHNHLYSLALVQSYILAHMIIFRFRVETVMKGLKHENCRITDLNLCGNRIGGSRIIEALVNALVHSKVQSLSGNNLNGPSTSRAIARLIENNRLEYLSLDGNNIGNIGVTMIAEALMSRKCKLRWLSLVSCQADKATLEDLINTVPRSYLVRLLLDETYGNILPNSLSRTASHIRSLLATGLLEVILTLLSVNDIPRIGVNSPLQHFPKELTRKLIEMLFPLEIETDT